MSIQSLTAALREWDQTRLLSAREVYMWSQLCQPPPYLDYLRAYEANGHLWVPLLSNKPVPLVHVARQVHQEGYQSRYFPNPELLPRDSAGRRILATDTDATQLPGITGIAWMCGNKKHIDGEKDIYGLMYELIPRRPLTLEYPPNDTMGWRTLPLAKLFMPTDRPSPLSEQGIQLLDELERSGALIVESSGLSVRPTAPNPGLIFHEILRRMVHQAIIVRAHGGAEKVLAFAIVEGTRDSIRVRMGADNFVPLGASFTPPGNDVNQETLLAPSIVELCRFFDRMVTSYRKAQELSRETGRQPKVLIRSIRDYTRGLPWRYLREYPGMIELLAELDESAPSKHPRDAKHGWHDHCEHNRSCHACYPPVSMYDHIPGYRRELIAA